MELLTKELIERFFDLGVGKNIEVMEVEKQANRVLDFVVKKIK